MSERKRGRTPDDPGHTAAPETEESSLPSLSRRKFLSISLAAGGAALAAPVRAIAQPEFEGWPDGFGMLTDFTACVGCRSCERACNEVNHLPEPEKPFTDGSVFEEDRWPTAKAFTVVN